MRWSALLGKYEMARYLLERGTKPNLPDDLPWATPLLWAKQELLLSHGATA